MRKEKNVNITKSEKGEKIDSLQALRTMAFLGIFFSHADFVVSWPALGVSVFFVLSGFLTYRKYEKTEYTNSLRDDFAFSWKKISKLYPLHIITMCFAIVLAVGGVIHKGNLALGFSVLSGEILLNVTLLQTWFPYLSVNVSLNGVAWFLSTSMFLFWMFPRVKKWIQSKRSGLLWIVCIMILGLEIIACIPMRAFLGGDSLVYIWFMYCFPVFRLGDFFIGCCLSKWYFERQGKNISALRATNYEICAVIFTVMVFKWLTITPHSAITEAMHNWTTIYIPIAVIWVVLFTEKKGVITRLLCNKLTIYLGDISGYMFLIHYVMIQWIKTGLKYMNVYLKGWRLCMLALAELGATIIVSYVYDRIRKKRILVHEINHTNSML